MYMNCVISEHVSRIQGYAALID